MVNIVDNGSWPDSYLEVAGLLFFLSAVLKILLFGTGWWTFQLVVTGWAIISTRRIMGRSENRTESWFLVGLILWFLEIVLVVATESQTPTLYDTPGFLREALSIQSAGGFDGLILSLFRGNYPFFNRNPLIPYLCSLVYRPGLRWFITAKSLAVGGWILAVLGLFHFARRWFNPRVGLVAVGVVGLVFPVIQYQVGWVGADLTVLGLSLVALGNLRRHSIVDLLLGASMVALAYWTKANALFLLPFLLVIIFLESPSHKLALKKGALFAGTWSFLVSPILTNNWLNHSNPFYNMNQRYLLVPRDYAGDVSDSISSLPAVPSLSGQLQYLAEGVLACFQGFWYLMDLPGLLAGGFVAFVVLGTYVGLRHDVMNLIPLLYALASFLAQGLNYYVSPRFMFFGWAVLIVYGSYGIVRMSSGPVATFFAGHLEHWQHDRSSHPVSLVFKIIPVVIGMVLFAGTALHYPRVGRANNFLTSVQEPPHWSELKDHLKRQNVENRSGIADGPSNRYALEYAGYFNTDDLPDVRRWKDLQSWLQKEEFEWILVDQASIQRRQILKTIGFSTSKNTIKLNRRTLPETLRVTLQLDTVVLLHYILTAHS